MKTNTGPLTYVKPKWFMVKKEQCFEPITVDENSSPEEVAHLLCIVAEEATNTRRTRTMWFKDKLLAYIDYDKELGVVAKIVPVLRDKVACPWRYYR